MLKEPILVRFYKASYFDKADNIREALFNDFKLSPMYNSSIDYIILKDKSDFNIYKLL